MHQLNRLIAMLLTVVILFSLTGCNGARETDVVAYVLAIGIDKSEKEEGKFDITFQIAIPRALAAGGAGGKPDESQFVITLTATNLADARNRINTIISRPPTWSHTKIFFIGEPLARAGIGDLISPILRYREFRGSINIAVVNQGTAKELMKNNRPILEQNISRWFEVFLVNDNDPAFYIRSQVHDVYKQLKSQSESPYLTMFALQEEKTEVKRQSMVPGSRTQEYEAGGLSYETKEKRAEAAGTALFNGDKMVGTLTTEETRSLQILKGKMQRSFIIVTDPLVPEKAVNTHIRMDGKPKISVKLQEGRPVVNIKVKIEGEITSIPSGTNYEAAEYKKLLETKISDVLYRQMTNMLVKTQEAGCDAVGFGYYARKLFWTYDEFEQLDWHRLYPESKFNITIETTIRRTGLMIQTSPLKDGGIR